MEDAIILFSVEESPVRSYFLYSYRNFTLIEQMDMALMEAITTT
jgi:hypothetical protein